MRADVYFYTSAFFMLTSVLQYVKKNQVKGISSEDFKKRAVSNNKIKNLTLYKKESENTRRTLETFIHALKNLRLLQNIYEKDKKQGNRW